MRCMCLMGLWLAATAGPAAAADPREACEARLTQLGEACLVFMAENDGAVPERLSLLYYRAYVDDLQTFACPAQTVALTGREEIDTRGGYVLVDAAASAEPRPLLRDRSPQNHGGAGVNVFYSTGEVRWEPAGGAPEGRDPDGAAPAPGPPETARVAPDVYAAALPMRVLAEGGWGVTQTDRSVTQKPLGIGGVTYAHGIGTHASSRIAFDIAGRGFARFVGYVGIDQAATKPHGSCTFRVRVDGDLRFDSGILRNGDRPARVEVDVTRASEVILEVTDAGDGIYYDQANWADAGFTLLPGSATPGEQTGVGATDATPGPVREITAVIGSAVYFGARMGSVDVSDTLWAAGWETLTDADISGLIEGLVAAEKVRALRIIAVQSGGVAAAWGLVPGDCIVLAGNHPVTSSAELRAAITEASPGSTLALTVLRNASQVEVLVVSLGELPALLARGDGLATDAEPEASITTGQTVVSPGGPVTQLAMGTNADAADPPAGSEGVIAHGTPRIVCRVLHTGGAGTQALVRWYRDGALCALSLGVLPGSEPLVACLTTADAQPCPPGTYWVEVIIAEQRAAGRCFVVR